MNAEWVTARKRVSFQVLLIFFFSTCFLAGPGYAENFIKNIKTFLEVCPQSDGAYTQIRTDFKIRKNGILVGAIACAPPISGMPIASYSDELIVLQGLRVIYYMDLGKSGHLPWTPGTLYQWMKSKIGGINISTTAGGSSCCEYYGVEKPYITIMAQGDSDRDDDRYWKGIAGNIDLYAHEARHVDGFGHVSCCGPYNGCDNIFNVYNLSPYGIQWWLNRSWLNGDINVGFSCLSSNEIQDIANWHFAALNYVFRDRFCSNQPAVVTMPQNPGGTCSEHFPMATTRPATKVTQNSVTLNGTVNPQGLVTTYSFQYGRLFYDHATRSQYTGSGTGDVLVLANLVGLMPNTVYHYRLVGVNSAGTSYGADMTFKTLPRPMPWVPLLLGE